MTGIELWSTAAGSNNATPPNGWPEGQAPSTVNDCARQMMAAIRSWYENAEWINYGHVPTYVSTTSFTIPTDVTARYTVGRRLKLVSTLPTTLYGTISASTYSAPNTTITVTMDSGVLDSLLSSVSYSLNSVSHPSLTTSAISGAGNMANQNANAVAITGGSIAGLTTGVPVQIGIAVSDEATALTTGTAKVTFRMPHAMTLTAVRSNLNTVSSSGLPTVDIKMGGTTVLSTLLSIDANEKTSQTAATPAVISVSALTDDAEMTIDITTAGTGAKGLKVWLIGTLT